MRPGGRSELADLICVSTNYWYRAAGKPVIFNAGPTATCLFADVYEALDPGCCVVAEDPDSRRLMGSCFYHPRETHVSLGIMNVHPDFFGRGVAVALLRTITDFADERKLPTRLVSSAMNLDSFSLYSRAGFVPTASYVDVQMRVDASGCNVPPNAAIGRVRPATADDVPAIIALEDRVAHVRREKDWRHFIENRAGIWHTVVHSDESGEV